MTVFFFYAEMRQKFLMILCSLIVSINLIAQTTVPVYASAVTEESEEVLGHTPSEWADGVLKSSAGMSNMLRLLFEQIGVVLHPDLWGTGQLFELYKAYMVEKQLLESADNYYEYLDSHTLVEKDDNGEDVIVFDTDFMNSVYNFATDYIENNTPYCNFVLNETSLALGSECRTQQQYKFIANWNDAECFLYECGYQYTTLGGALETSTEYLYYIPIPYTIDFVFDDQGKYYAGGYYRNDIDIYKDWEVYYPEKIYLDEDGNEVYRETLTTNVIYYWSLYSQGQPSYYNNQSGGKYYNSYFVSDRWIGKGGSIRAFFSVADMKNYSANTRPYYLGSQYFDYSTENDNSTTISENDLQNSSIYGDVYNIIIEYDDPDGLTEEELRAILDEYLKKLQDAVDDDDNDDSGGGSSDDNDNNDDDDDSSDSLFDFLEGLGSIGDAILSILGKLLEYVGKAIDLLSGTVTKVIDLIPQNITNLLGGLFPFLPEEWLTAIELSLVLAVIVGVVGIFKK